MFKKIVLSIATFTLGWIFPQSGFSAHEDATQALASLACSAEQNLQNNKEEFIEFTHSDLVKLWEKALEESIDQEAVYQAYQGYMNALQNDKGWDRVYQDLCDCWKAELDLEVQDPIKTLSSSFSYNDFDTNPYISDSTRKQVKPYLMPYDHPIRPALDVIFLTSRATQNEATLANAGFSVLHSQPRSFIKVVRHPILPNYLLKLYLDNELRLKHNKPGWKWLVRRCEGAKKIKNVIDQHRIKHFVVASKWIYPLPVNPAPPATINYRRQNFILAVTDMDLVSSSKNNHYWKTRLTKSHLDELYIVISKGMGSSYRPDNVCFTKQGPLAFIDTEYPHRKPELRAIRNYLSNDMKAYWDRLVKNGGPRR